MAYAQAKQLDPELIPVVDITDLRTGRDAKAVARQLHSASQTLGFIYIKGHGIAEAAIAEARTTAYDFFGPVHSRNRLSKFRQSIAAGLAAAAPKCRTTPKLT